MKKKHVIIAVIVIVLLLIITSFIIYLKSIIIYQPFTISISGLNLQQAKSVRIYGITPLGRQEIIQYEEKSDVWRNDDYAFFKAVHLFIPDSLERKISGFLVGIKYDKFTCVLKDLQVIDRSGGINRYGLPYYVRSKDSVVKMIPSVLRMPVFIFFVKIMQAVAVLFILWFFMRRMKNKKPSRTLSLLFSGARLKNLPVISPHVMLWLKIVGFSVVLACGLFFGFLLIRFTMASYITAVLFILFSGMLIWVILQIICRAFKVSQPFCKKINKSLIVFLLVWFCLESLLRIAGINKSYNETIGFYYSSGFNENLGKDKQNPHLWVHPKYEHTVYKRTEFAYEINCNADGLRDIDHPIDKEKNEYRIICLGNSFTEGVGAPRDSAWPALLETRLKPGAKRKITVFNAGNSGSDTFFEYMLLNERMLKYNPDLVLLSLGASDVNFYRYRGGFERFTPDGYRYRKGPGWEKLYAVSYIVRFIINKMHYQYFLSPADYKLEMVKALSAIKECIYRFNELALKHGFKLAVVFYDDGNDEYIQLIKSLKNERVIPVIDLFDYNKSIEKLNKHLRKRYFWPIDGLFNPRGYDLFAKGVVWNMKKMGIVDSLNIE